jgi:adenylate cyclase
MHTLAHEIERKFLVRRVPDGVAFHSIVQGYLAAGPPEVRVRIQGERFEMTVKGPDTSGAAAERVELTLPLAEDDARALMSLCTSSLRKWRARLGRWEIDRYEGALDGLRVAEVELSHAGEPLPELPEGLELGPEVTSRRVFRNQALSRLTESAARRLVRLAQTS